MGFGNAKAERKAIEMTYEDTCEVIRAVETEVGNITKPVEQIVYKDIPCALSTGNSTTYQTETVNKIDYDVKIFFAPEIEIKAGDKIRLCRLGKEVYKYKNVGETSIYETHQEIMAKRSDWV